MKWLRGLAAASKGLSRAAVTGDVELPASVKEGIGKSFGEALTAEQVVGRILEQVKARGDAAIREYSKKLDGIRVTGLEVPHQEMEEAVQQIPPDLRRALTVASRRIFSFHLARKPQVGVSLDPEGVGAMAQPLARAGVYAPGGRARYPSTVLMTVLPAKAAGVPEVVLCTPPGKDGRVPAATLAAAHIAGADRVFRIGGAQAIAAMAYGTKSVPRVDKVCGPGNIFVMLAKRAVFGAVDIDGLQGPSELAVVADDSADPYQCAADLLAQGEHDPLAGAVLIATSAAIAQRVVEEVENQLVILSRTAIAAEAVRERGIVAVVADIDEAVELVNIYAPEHVSLAVRDAMSYVPKVRNAGCIFVGQQCAPAIGDFVAGPSHVLPTGGTARFASPLTTTDFIKATSVIAVQNVSPDIAGVARTIAQYEGLDGHARSVELRTPVDER